MTATLPREATANLLQKVQEYQKDFAEGLRRLKESGLLVYRAAGNISVRIPDQDLVIIANTNGPNSGVTAVVDFDLNAHQGVLSDGLREVTALHLAILKERPQANSVIHLHTPYLTGFCVAGRPLPNTYNPLLMRTPEAYPVSDWGPRDAAEPVIVALKKHPHAQAVLLANHGPFAWSDSLLGAVNFLIALEESAHVFFIAEQLGGVSAVPADAYERVQQGRKKFYGGAGPVY